MTMDAAAFENEIDDGKRFKFGRNWSFFLRSVNEERIAIAKQALQQMLGVQSLVGRSFLDIGSGSGLSSLAAHLLGARVHSFDYDPQSVACTEELKTRYAQSTGTPWTVERGSALDRDYLGSLGTFDVVYSWGVLHHTGKMWDALENAASRVGPQGSLFIAIYNDQGWVSDYWKLVKKAYNTGRLGAGLMVAAHLPYPFGAALAYRFVTGRLREGRRGMTYWYDLLDWLGGLPFEVASAEEISSFFSSRGFTLKRSKVTTRSGCSEFVFSRTD